MVLFLTVLRFEPRMGFQYPSWLAVLSVLCPSSQAYCHARATPSCSTLLPPLWCVLAANQSAVWLYPQRRFLGIREVQESIINRSRRPQGTRCAGLLESSSSSQTVHPTLVCVHEYSLPSLRLCVWSVKCPSLRGVNINPVVCVSSECKQVKIRYVLPLNLCIRSCSFKYSLKGSADAHFTQVDMILWGLNEKSITFGLKFLNGSIKKHLLYPVKISSVFSTLFFLVHVALYVSELCWLRPSLPWSDEQTIDMCRFPIRLLQILWCVRHLAITIIINEYWKIYKRITCCCRRTQSMRSKICRPFQKWRMACISRPIETAHNEASKTG